MGTHSSTIPGLVFLFIYQHWAPWTTYVVYIWTYNPVKAGLLLWIFRKDFFLYSGPKPRCRNIFVIFCVGRETFFSNPPFHWRAWGIPVLERSLFPDSAWALMPKSLDHRAGQCPLACPSCPLWLQLHQLSCSWSGFQFPVWGSLLISFTFFLSFFFFLINLFLATLGLCCCAQAFSSCGERGLLFVAVRGLLIVVASLVAEHRL